MKAKASWLLLGRYTVKYSTVSAEEKEFEKVMDAIKAVRARRSEMNVPPSKKATLYIETASEEIFRQSEAFLTRLAWADQIVLGAPEDAQSCVQVITDSAKIFMPLSQAG